MKQTAVEYLIDQLFPKVLTAEQYFHIEQAKEMEKQQQGYSKEKVDKLLDTLLHYNMCSIAGDELIEKFKNK